VVVGPRVVFTVDCGKYDGPLNGVVLLVVWLVVTILVVGGPSHLGLSYPFVQQYFPFPPFSQQSLLSTPLKQQYLPLPPFGHFGPGVGGGGFGVLIVGVGGVGSEMQPGLFAPFRQQYFPLPPFSQQSILFAPFLQQNGPLPSFLQQSGPEPPFGQQSGLFAPFVQQNGPNPPEGQGLSGVRVGGGVGVDRNGGNDDGGRYVGAGVDVVAGFGVVRSRPGVVAAGVDGLGWNVVG